MKVYFSKTQSNFGSTQHIALLTESRVTDRVAWADSAGNRIISHVVSSQLVGNNHGRTKHLY